MKKQKIEMCNLVQCHVEFHQNKKKNNNTDFESLSHGFDYSYSNWEVETFHCNRKIIVQKKKSNQKKKEIFLSWVKMLLRKRFYFGIRRASSTLTLYDKFIKC